MIPETFEHENATRILREVYARYPEELITDHIITVDEAKVILVMCDKKMVYRKFVLQLHQLHNVEATVNQLRHQFDVEATQQVPIMKDDAGIIFNELATLQVKKNELVEEAKALLSSGTQSEENRLALEEFVNGYEKLQPETQQLIDDEVNTVVQEHKRQRRIWLPLLQKIISFKDKKEWNFTDEELAGAISLIEGGI